MMVAQRNISSSCQMCIWFSMGAARDAVAFSVLPGGITGVPVACWDVCTVRDFIDRSRERKGEHPTGRPPARK